VPPLRRSLDGIVGIGFLVVALGLRLSWLPVKTVGLEVKGWCVGRRFRPVGIFETVIAGTIAFGVGPEAGVVPIDVSGIVVHRVGGHCPGGAFPKEFSGAAGFTGEALDDALGEDKQLAAIFALFALA
jgi:hypothetical protein